MTEKNGTPETGTEGQKKKAEPPRFRILTQFVRDLSFENILSRKAIDGEAQPDINVRVNLDARKRKTDGQYEVAILLKIESKTRAKGEPLFIMEMDYCGVFHIENVPLEQLHPFLMIECPRMLFPFARRIVHDMTRDGGFPSLNLEMIDFVQLYRNELARRAKTKKPDQPVS